MITQLKDNEIFVFGSNAAGLHRGGAAKQAIDQFGAEWGVGEGITGKCYAFPTLDSELNKRSKKELELSRDLLYHACDQNKDKQFLLTKVGCGIAGYHESAMRELFNNPPVNLITPSDWPISTVLVLRTCSADMRSEHQAANGFQWPESGPVSAPDWLPTTECGNGLHGLLWGECDSGLLNHTASAKALVVKVAASDIIQLQGKVKFPRGHVVFCGTHHDAAKFILANGGAGKAVHYGTATAGYRGTATAGDRGTATAGCGGTATAGDGGTATAGYRGTATAGCGGTATAGYGGTATAGYRGTATAGCGGTATAGDRGTATAGCGGTATAGYGGTATAGCGGTATAGCAGVISIQYWNGKRYKTKIAHVKDGDGDGELEPNTPYVLNNKYEFTKVEKEA